MEASVGGVELTEELGRGAHSIVYAGERDGGRFAVKLQRDDIEGDKAAHSRRFVREVAALARIDHPSLPTVWSAGEHEGRRYLVMDLFDGTPLDEFLEDRQLAEHDALRIGIGIANGLSALHAAGFVHRDIKPSNVIWDGRRARLVDFGLVAGTETGSVGASDADQTTIAGTLAYASPEQLNVLKRPVTERSDLYSLGALLFECCAGRPPFEFDEAEQLVQKHAVQTAPSVAEVQPYVSRSVVDVIDRLLSKDPDDRFVSAREASRALSQSLSELSGESTPVFDMSRSLATSSKSAPELAGRQDEQTALMEAWLEVREEHSGRLVAVRGAPGMGKTTLVRNFTDFIESEASAVVEIDCRSGTARSFGALRRLIHKLLDESAGAEASDRLEAALDQIDASERLRRFVAGRFDPETLREAGDLFLETERIVGEVVRLLLHVARTSGPVVLVVEGCQSADSSIAYAIRRLCDHLSETSILIVATFDESSPESELTLDRLRTNAGLDESSARAAEKDSPLPVVEVQLDALDLEKIALFVQVYLDADIADEKLLQQLASTSGGNPLLLRQLIDTLLEEEVLRPDWDGWSIDLDRFVDIDLPSSVRDLLVRRLDHLEEESLEVCRAGAVWGSTFPVEPVAHALELEAHPAHVYLDAAVQADLLEREEGSGDLRYAFVHEAIRHALLEEFPTASRQRVHQRYAEWLEAHDATPAQIADHYLQGDDSRPERVHEVCLEAGRQSAANHDFEGTRKYLEAATRIAEERGLTAPAEAWYLLGGVYAETEDIDLARPHLERAAQSAESPVDAARYELKIVQIQTVRFKLDDAEVGAERALERLGVSVPSTALGKIFWLAVYALVNYWREKIAGKRGPTEGDDEPERLKVEAYEKLSFVGIFDEKPVLSLYSYFARTHAATKLGPSVELVHDYLARAVMNALLGRSEHARRHLEEARTIVESLDDPFAQTRVNLGDAWILHIGGEPVEAGRISARALEEHGEQLAFYPRSIAIDDICINFGLRGYARRVVYWYRQWLSMHGVQVGTGTPGAIYSNALGNAWALGAEELAHELRETSERVARESGSSYLKKLHVRGLLSECVFARPPTERIEEVLEQCRALDLDPKREVFWGKKFFVSRAHAHRLLSERADEADRASRLEGFSDAIEDLEEAAGDHPTLRSHAVLLRAVLAHLRGEPERAFSEVGRAEELAWKTDNQWVLAEAAECRAEWLRERDDDESKFFARRAVEIARRLGWSPFAERLTERFDLEEDDESVSVSTISSQGTDITADDFEARRKLDALLEVSMATSSILEPDEVSRVALDSAIRVLGAARGFLFLTDSPPLTEISELDAHMVTRTDRSDREEGDEFSTTVLEEIIETGEPVVVRGTEEGVELGAQSIVANELRSIIAAPLFIDGGLVGAIYLDNQLAKGVFDERDVEVLRAIANHVPTALETAKAAQLKVDVATEREKRQFAEQLRTFTNEVNELFDVEKILGRTLEELEKLFDFDHGWAARVSEDALESHCRAGENGVESSLQSQVNLEPPAAGEYIQSVLETETARMISPVDEGDREREPFIIGSARSWFALPLKSGSGDIVGIVALSDRQPEAFATGHFELSQATADQAGLAIEKTLLATVDPLTDVYNRRKLFDLADREVARARRYGHPLSVLMLDIDDFKQINDHYGHSAGDTVLSELASVCEDSLRETDAFGRYGGEEFAAILPETTAREANEEIGERLRRNVDQTGFETDQGRIDVTVSIGVATMDDSIDDIRQLLERADEALYKAKRSGKNRVAAEPSFVATESRG